MSEIMTGILREPLNVAEITESVQDDRCGAVVTFQGVVRNHDSGEKVTAIDYSYHPLAPDILAQLAEKILERDQVHRVRAWHRVGRLEVGDVAMVIAVSAEHRMTAFTAVSDLANMIKAKLPVWKKQMFADGSHAWSGLP